jgi:hypothetical protein
VGGVSDFIFITRFWLNFPEDEDFPNYLFLKN